jgi:hypothetical protein
MSGDATISNSGAITLANTTVTAGTYGSSTIIPVLSVDSKGRINLASTASGNFQPLNSYLTAIAGLTPADHTSLFWTHNRTYTFPYVSGSPETTAYFS